MMSAGEISSDERVQFSRDKVELSAEVYQNRFVFKTGLKCTDREPLQEEGCSSGRRDEGVSQPLYIGPSENALQNAITKLDVY